MEIIKVLKLQDYSSILAISFGWISILLVINENPNLSINFFLIAFLFDILDGYIARKSKKQTEWGRLLDTLGDLVIYIIYSTVLFTTYISPNFIVSVFVGINIIVFGILRLIRYTNAGALEINGKRFFLGINVVLICMLIIFLFILNDFINNQVFNIISSILIFLFAPLMISNIKTRKPGISFLIPTILILSILNVILTLWK